MPCAFIGLYTLLCLSSFSSSCTIVSSEMAVLKLLLPSCGQPTNQPKTTSSFLLFRPLRGQIQAKQGRRRKRANKQKQQQQQTCDNEASKRKKAKVKKARFSGRQADVKRCRRIGATTASATTTSKKYSSEKVQK